MSTSAAKSSVACDASASGAAKEKLSVTAPSHPVSSAMDTQPNKSGGSSCQTQASPTASNNMPVAPKSSVLRFPVRIGITWRKGEKLEAQDFSNTWYPSKIVEISEEEKAVLIHFEGWNQRYDEWVHMASDRLRPTTRHSERKDKGISKRRRVHPHPIYRPGDEVLARWKDCKKYPAKISRLIEESTYEVVFYDGVTHLIQAMNIQPLTEEMKAAVKSIPPPPKPKPSFKQVQVNLPVSIRKKQEQQQEKSKQTLAGKMLAKSQRSPSKLAAKAKLLPKVTLRRDRELDVFSVVGNKGPPSPPKKVHKEIPVPITCEATLSTLSEAECLQLFGSAAVGVGGASLVNRSQPSSSLDEVSTIAVASPQGLSTGEIAGSSLGTIHEVLPKTGRDRKGGKKHSGSRVRKRAYTDTGSGGVVKRKKLASVSTEYGATSNTKTAKKPQPPPLGSSERSKSLDTPGYLAGTPSPLAPLAPQIFVPSKAFIVEEDHNPFKCPYDGCTKDFRKENLLQYHIKYYHTGPEANSTSSPVAASHSTTSAPLQVPGDASTALTPGSTIVANKPRSDTTSTAAVQTPSALSLNIVTPSICTPKRRRRKTDSIYSSRLVQELAAGEELPVWPGTEEADEEEMASDMVNCVCGERHHTGLMIQILDIRMVTYKHELTELFFHDKERDANETTK
ncbi:PHD finger protein 20-like protein 1 [Elysia marginata]|uniref:PHD finger protein 20-like protein 1 n=1 Tax=Elysia marginata TaxID=1093978 RepID=A0AAV4FVZ7_9GAST|nr:PHD finger protein 20-like protein 1 [Elysia marginata]